MAMNRKSIVSFSSFGSQYLEWFGEPDEAALEFYRWNALPN